MVFTIIGYGKSWNIADKIPTKFKITVNSLLKFFVSTYYSLPIPVAERFKAWICGRSLAGIAGSNPAGGMDVCLLRVLCVVCWQVEVCAMDRSLARRSPTECDVSECDREASTRGGPGPLGLSSHKKHLLFITTCFGRLCLLQVIQQYTNAWEVTCNIKFYKKQLELIFM